MSETLPLLNPKVKEGKFRFNLKSILILSALAYFAYTYVIIPTIKTIKDRKFKGCLNDCVNNATLCRISCSTQLNVCHQNCPIEDLECNQECTDYFKLACYSPCGDNGYKCANKCKVNYS